MIAEQYVWLTWSSAFLVPWLALFWWCPRPRRPMWWASLFTTPFGLAEPLFVPEYWSPPRLFDLARRTGFDIESLIFCFAIGGVGAALYNVLTGKVSLPIPEGERRLPLHRYHALLLASPFLTFAGLYFLPCNPIYSAIVAMAVGASAAVWCRPDLKRKTWIGGLLFLGYYLAFLVGLKFSAPGYIERVWNLEALSGVVLLGFPREELLFAVGFGMYWAGVYEHFTWTRAADPQQSGRKPAAQPPEHARSSACGQGR